MDDNGGLRFGVDIGGSGVKGAPVALSTGELTQPRLRLDTPHPATPAAVADVVARVVAHFSWHGEVGVTFPGVITGGVVRTAANMDSDWIDFNGEMLFSERTSCPVHLLNDADAAGIAEMSFGAGRNQQGVVLMITLGTGIGSALFYRGVLVPNTELGHIEVDGHVAENRAAARIREEKKLSWKKYTHRLERYLQLLDEVLTPDLIIIGGGITQQADKFIPKLNLRCAVVPAVLMNDAGIVGAALAYRENP